VEHVMNGKFVYISEIGILDIHKEYLFRLVEKMVEKAKKDGCDKAIWLTSQKEKHDKIELQVLKQFKFVKLKQVFHWEVYPNHFLSDHWLYEKVL